MTETDNLQRVIEVAQEAAEPNALLDLTSYAVVAPTGSHVERFFVDQEVTENRPRRRHGTSASRPNWAPNTVGRPSMPTRTTGRLQRS
jgi:hypothetical protein